MSDSRELDAMERERFVRLLLDEVARAEAGATFDSGHIVKAPDGVCSVSRGELATIARAMRERVFREIERAGFEVRRR